ncbi:MAG: hypothetical protein GY923_04870 [Aestuariibacter sp.]|nr:hypothetical protein [Aestuariibacter sp.]MCP4524776.1 hypothetical protein [Aestuariibacter sp.]MCP4946817.1 hypothetical protein [Aestuariibacter sp.]
MVVYQRYSVPEASRVVDVHENSLRKWVQQLECECCGSIPKSKAFTPDLRRIKDR